jgi:hypothetical protein
VALSLTGCRQGPVRISVRGTVTYQEANVADGWITFVPKNAEKGTQEAARITDGKYELPSANGLLPGEYLVSITATEGTAKPAAGELPGAPRRGKALIPDDFNRNSTLSIQVSAEGKREFDFNLK